MEKHPHPPSVEELQAYSLGAIEAERALDIESFLASGPDCSAIFDATNEDELVGHLRGLKELPKTPIRISASGDTTVDSNPEIHLEAFREHPRYRLIRKLGEGGMGTVYLAEHKLMRRQVAIKMIRTGYLGNANLIERFRREVRAAASLSHPNIVTAYDADEVSGFHFLAMEYVDGESLAALLARLGPLPVADACNYIRQAARGLEFAHANGMVHRDIKPHNLILTRDGLVKILDFGLARIRTDEDADRALNDPDTGSVQSQNERLSLTGTVMGTADYVAPEQARDSRHVDGRADIYSLGCSLYHLISGCVPFPDGSAKEKIVKHASDTPDPLAVPPALTRAIEKMMAKNPEDRYGSAGEVAADLGQLIREPGEHSMAAQARRRRRQTIALICFFAGTLGVGISAIWSRLSPLSTSESNNLTNSKSEDEITRAGLLHHLAGMPASVINARFSPDSKYVSLEGMSKTPFLRIWEVESGRVVLDVKEIAGDWNSSAFTPDHKILVLHADRHFRLWDLASQQWQPQKQLDECPILDELGDTVCIARLSPDGKILALLDAKDDLAHSIVLVDMATGKAALHVKNLTDGGILYLNTAFSRDCKKFFVFHAYKEPVKTTFCVWDVETCKLINTFEVSSVHGHGRLALRDDARQIGIDFTDEITQRYQFGFWDIDTGKKVRQVSIGSVGNYTSACVSSDGRWFAHVSQTQQLVSFYDLDTGGHVLTHDHMPGAAFGDFSMDGRFAAIQSYGGMHVFRMPVKK
jgi:serine/threonine protein kinase